MNVLIIGGVAAGTKVAAKLKRDNYDINVTILTKEKNISYAGCGLPYYVGNVIENRQDLIVNTPESFSKLTGVEVLTQVEVTRVDPDKKEVEAIDLKNNESNSYTYDKLVIATGADPIKPPIEGTELEGVYFMRTPEDAISLREAIEAGKIKRALVVGGGFIGLEVAENLVAQGVRVSVIDMAHQILPGFEPEIASYVENHLSDHGIITFTETKLEAILGDERVEKVKTSRNTMKADAVIISVGIRPNTGFLADTGIQLARNKAIIVNEHMETNIKDIYALGDCAMVKNKLTGKETYSPMGSSANIEGRILAQNLNGKDLSYKGVLGTSVVKLPGLNVGKTGLTEEAAIIEGYDVVSVTAVVDDKAHYYPGASNFILKMVADRNTKKLLGLQVLGEGAVDKMVDIAVMAISLGASLDNIKDLDLAYAPPFSTAIHPFSHTVNILLNKINGEIQSITPREYLEGKAKSYKVIDASLSPSIAGATFVDLSKVDGELPDFDKDEELLLVCTKGKRAYMLQKRLKGFGYTNTLVLEGGTSFNKVSL
ncbi:FAD-dependent oxidoreductase [Tepidimicrobium xylanilyticum]|uniref:NADPH-dependent 2,4-dienoyl-CoA reductase, sulfur reductase n=1 Tax=Tepidimicrobium xylanilyticum TaxID=1123352 RepID=A0A1H2ZLL6_9FIRM|nr:FAD-dependent oxidoreductase [Tepidimicrobium xylanilyticum]GMG96516.1 pyridine nucleotide-disulfide oxidoreductase [Tepidimicrobium xylanilyticum]SDX17858.1 NADPH-dependent 2,4-dienoyl-CoA reductase, sulfur reductase [Tepidimicrobium xylanilyticum]